MLSLALFWFGLLGLFALALMFCLPALWFAGGAQVTSLKRFLLVFALTTSLGAFCLATYLHLGSSDRLLEYNLAANQQQLQNQAEIRPLFARLQRELIKSKLNLKVAQANIDLIINFATMHAELGEGILPVEVQDLLLAVLKVAPQQVTVLNLLAVNAYKMQRYPQAVAYWRQILQQFTPQMRNSPAEQVLTAKIAETEAKYLPSIASN